MCAGSEPVQNREHLLSHGHLICCQCGHSTDNVVHALFKPVQPPCLEPLIVAQHFLTPSCELNRLWLKNCRRPSFLHTWWVTLGECFGRR